MTIGLDLSVIQTPHRMRGIGAVAINFVNNIPDNFTTNDKFVFYLHKDGEEEALSILKTDILDFEIRHLGKAERINLNLPGKLRLFNSLVNYLKSTVDARRGDLRISGHDLNDLDVFLQFDPLRPLPKTRKVKKGLIIYDLIPYVMESDYLWSYATSRRNQISRKASLKKALQRRQYISNAKIACNSADKIYAISKHTKSDYVNFAHVKDSRIKVVYLGVDENEDIDSNIRTPVLKRYLSNELGYYTKNIDIEEKPFILYVGGADPRRRINDLVAAYNNLRAEDYDVNLIMVGDTMQGPRSIPVLDVQKYLASSSYLDDILFLGFVTNEQRSWLFKNAVAMVYPSVYEGFGLPILEAMQFGTPVITYDNTSIREIANDAALYANGFLSIKDSIIKLMDSPKLRDKYKKLGKEQASGFSWSETTKKIIGDLTA